MHELDMTTGKAGMAYTGQLPWHGLGNKLDDDASIDEWQVAAGLNWTAEFAPVMYDAAGHMRTVPGRQVLYRSDSREPLSVVSDRYQAVQPHDILDFFRDIVEQYGEFRMETAGSLMGGKKIWALAKATEEGSFTLGKHDEVDRYLLLATSYDKSLPTIAMQTSVRVVCANTLRLAAGYQGKQADVRINHMNKFDESTVKRDLGLFHEEWESFRTTCDVLASTKVSDEAASLYFDDVLHPVTFKESRQFSEKGAAKRIDYLMKLYKTAPGQGYSSAKGTAWGLVNAMTYYYDHEYKARTKDARLNSSWFGKNEGIKERAVERAMQFANV